MFLMKQFWPKGIGWLPIKFSVGKQRDPTDKKTTFSDVAGMEEVKNEVQEIVDFLKNPDKYIKVWARIPKWVLLYWQPWTGKTLLARAVAWEAWVPFISASGSEFMEMLVGMWAAKVRELFSKAKAQSPAIIFIDEIDAIGKKRWWWYGGWHQEQEQTLNQILTEMDWFEQNTKVIVIASTNRPDTLDPALMRSWRFDRKILVTPPTIEERIEIVNYYLKDKKVDDSVNIESLAKRMSWFVWADIETIINESILKVAKEDRDTLTRADLDYGLEKVVMWPEKKSRRLSDHEREVVIYHELWHAITAYHLPNCDPVEKISIVSRGQALGVTWMMPDEDRHLYSKQKFLDECVSLLWWRAAEEVIYGPQAITTWASNDLERVTAHLRNMITKYGMDTELGTLTYVDDENTFTKWYSEQTAQLIDTKLRSLVAVLYEDSKNLIRAHLDTIKTLGRILDKKEYLHKEEFMELMAAGNGIQELAQKIIDNHS